MEYIIIIGAFQALLAFSLFIANRKRKPADNLLTWFLIAIFTHLSIKFIIYAASGNMVLKTAFNTFIDLAYGPLLWMYAQKVSNDRYRPLQHWYLLTPTVAASAIYTAITVRIAIDPASALRLLGYYNEITTYLIMASTTVFPLMSLQIGQKLPNFWSSEQKLIRKIAISFLIIPGLWIVSNIINALHIVEPQTLNTTIRIIAYSNMVLICLYIIQYRLSAQALVKEAAMATEPLQPETDFPTPAVLVEEKESLILTTNTDSVAAARKSTLTQFQQQAIAIKLSVLMHDKKVYTDPELTLEKLATMAKTPRHQLSEVLNQYLHQTFYQFINDYRIKEVLNRLDQCRRQQVTPNILSLAYDAGFNSKSSFNQYFKKTTGYTPTEYLKQPEQSVITMAPASLVAMQQSIHPQ